AEFGLRNDESRAVSCSLSSAPEVQGAMMRGALPLIRNPQSEIRRSAIPSRRPHRVVQRFSTLLLALTLALVPVFAQQPSTQSAQQQASRKSADPQPTPPLPSPRVKIEE